MKPGRLLIFCLGLTAGLTPGWAVSTQFILDNHDRLESLFGALDRSHPQLHPILKQWDGGKEAEACDALIAYFDQKSSGNTILQPFLTPGNVEEQARRALDNTFFLLGDWAAVPPGESSQVDWGYTGPGEDKEVAWMLNRHEILPTLSIAWQNSGNPDFRSKANSLWQDWITANPYPDRLTFSPQWRALEVARRINNSWLHAMRVAGLMDSETRLLALSSVMDHADALRHHASFWGGNHLITEKLALLTLAVTFPEFEEATNWQAHATDRVSRQIMDQTYPDGSHKEFSNHYQRVVLLNAEHFVRLLSQFDPAFREREVYGRITRMWEFFAGVMKPDGTGPLNNASDREVNARYLEEAWEFHNRPDWLAMATHGLKGILPDESPSRLYPWAGQVILRNNWSRLADWIYFDAGPYGTAHQHVDRFHISASFGGRPILTDSGRFTYQPGKWKDYFKGPDSHSILRLDGRPPVQGPRKVKSPMPVTFMETETVVFTGALSRFSFDGAVPGLKTPVPWIRAILYDKRGFAIIMDHLVTFQKHQLAAQWHFHPDISEEEADRSLALASPAGLLERSVRKGQATPPLGGFHSIDYNQKAPAVLFRQTGEIDRPTTLAWLLQSPAEDVVKIQILSEPGAPVLHFRASRGALPLSEARVRLHPDPVLLEYRTFPE
jgi:hypothetical protein